MKLFLTAVKLQKTLILLIGLALAACGKKTETVVLPPVKVNVVKAIQNDVPMYEDFVAQVNGESGVDIRSRVENWVTSVNFKEGSAVKKYNSQFKKSIALQNQLISTVRLYKALGGGW